MGSATAFLSSPFPIKIDYLLVGGGGGGGGLDSTSLGSTGGSGSAITGSFYFSGPDLYCAVGGAGGTGVNSASGAAGGAAGASAFGAGGGGGRAGYSGTSGGGGAGGGASALAYGNYTGSVGGIIAVAAGAGGGGGATEGTQDSYGGYGGNIQGAPNGTSRAGAVGFSLGNAIVAYDGGGGGGGGGGWYGGDGQNSNTGTVGASAGLSFHNTAICFTTTTYNGINGIATSATVTNPVGVPGGTAWGYNNNYGYGLGSGVASSTVNGGIVIVKYLGPQLFTGGTISTISGYTVHTMTSNTFLTVGV